MKIVITQVLLGGLLLLANRRGALAQGTFVNLSFESPVLPLVPDDFNRVTTANALPGWNTYVGEEPIFSVFYNTVAIGSPAISIHDSGSSIAPLFGNYSVMLQHSSGGTPATASIGQTAQLPADAGFVTFFAVRFDQLQLTFAGNSIPFTTLGDFGNFSVLRGDISQYAGQVGELRFTEFAGFGAEIDQIAFTPVPEPSSLGLVLAMGLVMVRICRRRAPK